MARTKRTTRKARTTRVNRAAGITLSKPVAALNALRANAAQAIGAAIGQSAALRAKGRKLALARTREVRNAVVNGASVARSRATHAVARFERVFEDRVTRVVSRLGVPTARDVRALSRQVAHLQQSVDSLRRVRAR